MKKFAGLAVAALFLIPVAAGAVPVPETQILGPDFSFLLGDICTITDDINPQLNRPPGRGNPDSGPIDFGENKTITDDINPQLNRPPGKGNPDGGPIDFGQN